LEDADFGVLGTVDPLRGVHLVPVVFVTAGDELAVPIDRVKAKSSTRLRRIDNLMADGRASLLVDHRSTQWDELWWVRVDLRLLTTGPPGRWAARFAERFAPYRDEASLESVLTFSVISMSGWGAKG